MALGTQVDLASEESSKFEDRLSRCRCRVDSKADGEGEVASAAWLQLRGRFLHS